MVIKCGRLYKQRRLFHFTWKSVGRQIESSERTSRSSVGSTSPSPSSRRSTKQLSKVPTPGPKREQGVKALHQAEIMRWKRAGYFGKVPSNMILSGGSLPHYPRTHKCTSGTPEKSFEKQPTAPAQAAFLHSSGNSINNSREDAKKQKKKKKSNKHSHK